MYLLRSWGWEERWKEREEKTSSIGELQTAVLPTDEFNRVIIPVKRGEENTDYVNASFIDVSALCVPGAPNTLTLHGDSPGPTVLLPPIHTVLERAIFESVINSELITYS